MKLLLDSHTLVWAVDNPARLGARAVAALRDPASDLLLSAATIWEVAIKIGLGKLSLSMSYRQWMSQAIRDLGLSILPITIEYANEQANLPFHHRDPFDRLLVAQARVDGMTVVSNDPIFDQYGMSRLW